MSNIFPSEPDQAIAPVTPAATTAATPATPVQDPSLDLLKTITNDSGEQKYKDVHTALDGLFHSQAHITQIESDNKELTKQIEQLKAGSLVEQLKTPQPVATPATTGLDESAVLAMIQKQHEETQMKESEDANKNKVVSTLQSKFGNRAEEVFYTTAAELGMTDEQMNSLAKTSPQAALAFFESSTPSGLKTTTPTINTAAMTPPTAPTKVPPSAKSVFLGASTKEVIAEMARHKEAVYAKYGLTN